MIEVVFSWASKTTLADFQSVALPTELSSHPPKKGRRILRIVPPCLKHFRDEPMAMPIAWLASRLKCAFSHLNVLFWAMRPQHRGGCLFPKGRHQQNTYPPYKACCFFKTFGALHQPHHGLRRRKSGTPERSYYPRRFFVSRVTG